MNVGSSSANLIKPLLNLSWSCLVFGSIANWITGSGNSIDSRIIGWSGSHKVFPVVTSFKPTAAAISPAYTFSISSLWFACIWRILPTLSFLSLLEFRTVDPDSSVPE